MSVSWPNGSTAQAPPRVTSEFGNRFHPVDRVWRLHAGIDLIGWSTIVAPANGVVSFAGYNGGAGNEVRIRADNGDSFRMLHNRELWVRTGQRVKQGDGVAVMGTTGSSTGIHCHFETRPGGGNPENPRDYMNRANASSPAGGGGTPIPPPTYKEEDVIIYRSTSNGAMGIVLKGGRWIQGVDGPLRQLDDLEYSVYAFYSERGIPTRFADWSGDQIESVVKTNGVREFGGNGTFAAGLSGRVRYNRDRVEFPGAHADNPATISAAQTKAIADLIVAGTKAGASKADVEAIVKAGFASINLVSAK